LNNTRYATLLTSDSGPEIVHTGTGADGLRDCQAYAQRLTEKNQGVAVVGRFVPMSKSEQRLIVKCQK